jgi:predicted DNA-binding transcriptional regulator AlpA
MIDRSKVNLLRLPQVQWRTGLSVPTIYRKIPLGQLPKQVKLSFHVVAWYEGDIDRWAADPMWWQAVA